MPLTKRQKVGAGVLTALGLSYLAWKFWPRPPVEDEEEPPVPGTATLRGYVTDGRTGKEIVGIEASINALVDTTTFRGRYKFTDIEATSYELVFTDPLERYETLVYGIVTLKPDKTKYVNVSLDLVVGAGGLWGYVTDSETGGVVTGQSIQLLRDGVKIVFDRTDASGKYEIVDVPAGSYTLFTESNIYKAHSELVTIVAGISQRKDLILEPKGVELGELMLDFPHDSLKGTLWNYGAITITNVIVSVECWKAPEGVTIPDYWLEDPEHYGFIPCELDRGVWNAVSGSWYYPTKEPGTQNLGTLLSGEPRKLSWRIRSIGAGLYVTIISAWGDNAPKVSKTIEIRVLEYGIFEFSNYSISPIYSPAVPTTVTAHVDILNTGSYVRYAVVEFLVNGTRIQPYDENIRYYNNGELVRGFNMRTIPGTAHIDVEYDIAELGTYEIALRCSPCYPGQECYFTDTVYIG